MKLIFKVEKQNFSLFSDWQISVALASEKPCWKRFLSMCRIFPRIAAIENTKVYDIVISTNSEDVIEKSQIEVFKELLDKKM